MQTTSILFNQLKKAELMVVLAQTKRQLAAAMKGAGKRAAESRNQWQSAGEATAGA